MSQARPCSWWGIAILTVVAGCAATTVRQSPDFRTRRREIRRIAVVSPDVTARERNLLYRNQVLADDSLPFDIDLSGVVKGAIERRFAGATVVDVDCAEPDRQADIENAREAFARFCEQAFARPRLNVEAAEHYRATLGSAPQSIARCCDVDALVFIRVSGFRRSSERVGFEKAVDSAVRSAASAPAIIPGAPGSPPVVLPGAPASPPSEVIAEGWDSLQVGIVDGSSGAVLWANAVDVEAQSVGVLIDEVFAGLPLER